MMKITTTRRISQIFFFVVFIGFCMVMTLGTDWWQLRGWPVNLFLYLDPLAGIGIMLTTGSLYKGMAWGVLTLVLTILFGRFFCGWVCPFGAMHQFIGFLVNRKRKKSVCIERNHYHSWQVLKYFVLIFFLIGPILNACFRNLEMSLQTGLLDPIPLVYRSVNLMLIPLTDHHTFHFYHDRMYDGAVSIGVIFIMALFMNLYIPRFFCRFICPLGALFGLMNRFALWRIGKSEDPCIGCQLCETHCEGACHPSAKMLHSECVLCMNCFHTCPQDLIGYRTSISKAGESLTPDFARRELLIAIVSGMIAVPTLRLDGKPGLNRKPDLIRPPGALPEKEFLDRCIKCGQCMRICPTNVIHPSGIVNGWENLWTPNLNFRIGTSGCQMTCIACGHICPTAAIRPLTLQERLGTDAFKDKGPIKIGTAFVDWGRCLPWAMDTPCIVCQENCPVSPKAIIIREHFSPLLQAKVKRSESDQIELDQVSMIPDKYATGDYYLSVSTESASDQRYQIQKNNEHTLWLTSSIEAVRVEGKNITLCIRLQRPVVDPKRCIGCGVCEHECPVREERAIRVSGWGMPFIL